MSPEKIIRRPIVLTEKASLLRAQSNTVVFEVARDANKIQIRNAVEKLFNVKVVSVNTARVHGKFRRHGRSMARQADWKKAFVRLKDGDAIELF